MFDELILYVAGVFGIKDEKRLNELRPLIMLLLSSNKEELEESLNYYEEFLALFNLDEGFENIE